MITSCKQMKTKYQGRLWEGRWIWRPVRKQSIIQECLLYDQASLEQ